MHDAINPASIRNTLSRWGSRSAGCAHLHDIVQRLYADELEEVAVDLWFYEATGEASERLGDILKRVRILREADRLFAKLDDCRDLAA